MSVLKSIAGLSAAAVILALLAIAAWLTHVVVAIGALVGSATPAMGYAVVLVLGVFVPPIGIIHGLGVWFGFW